MAQRRVAFLTSAQWASLYDDDTHAARALLAHGVQVAPLVWTQADAAALDAFDAVVMRSPWDWYHQREAFRAFLSLLRRVRVPVFNAPEVMVEFADKTVLPRLEAERGVRVVPTVVLAPAELLRVPEVLRARGWTTAVLKPAFTANAFGARRFEVGDAAAVVAEVRADAAAPDEPWLLQPFLEEIADGERSFVFFDGAFSHAVKKRPKAGDWRVQVDHGGTAERYEATSAEVAEATETLRRAAPGTLYARVDGVVHDGRLHLMELEVVEPDLFFHLDAEAPERFAAALVRRLPQAPR